MQLLNMKGFSLTSVLVAAGLLGGLSLAVMQVFKNINDGQTFARSTSEEIELRSEIRMILNNEKFCRISLAGDGLEGLPSSPVTFYKQDIDEDGEGLDVELWLSNQVGNERTRKRISGTDPERRKYGKLIIKSLKLSMNNEFGSNYSESALHSDMGELKIIFDKKVSSKKRRELSFSFPIIIGMSTSSGGLSTILTCPK